MRVLSSFSVLAIVAASVAAGFAAPAGAQQDADIALLANAPRGCVLGAPELSQAGVSVNFVAPSGMVYRIQELSDPATLTTRAARLRLNFDTMCNTAHRVVIISQNSGLWRNGQEPVTFGSFGTAVPYQLQVAWADADTLLNVQAAGRQEREFTVNVGVPYAGELELDFQITAGQTNAGFGAPMVEGGYSDTLTVRVEPQ